MIISNNTGALGQNCNQFTSLGYNLLGNGVICQASLGVFDIGWAIAGLDPLISVDNYTNIHPLQAISQAIDVATDLIDYGEGNVVPAIDQIGKKRPIGAVDIGSVEF